jgi:hypothetical protein
LRNGFVDQMMRLLKTRSTIPYSSACSPSSTPSE